MSRRIGLRTISNPGGTTEVPLEGDYSDWVVKWKQAYAVGEGDWNELVRVDEALDKIFTQSVTNDELTERTLADGSNPTVTVIRSVNAYSGSVLGQPWSILRKYFAVVVSEAGVPKLKIYKDGSLKQTIDLSASPISWTSTSFVYYVSFSPNGKFLLVDNTFNNEYALFQGS